MARNYRILRMPMEWMNNQHYSPHTSSNEGKFLKAVMKELRNFFFIQVLTALSTPSMESHTWPWSYSFVFGKRWKLLGTTSAPYGTCAKMVRSKVLIASMVVREVWGLYCSKIFFLCFQTLLQRCLKILGVAILRSELKLHETHPFLSHVIHFIVYHTNQLYPVCPSETQCLHQHSHHHKQPAFGSEFQLERLH
jgi:hypothetical protein